MSISTTTDSGVQLRIFENGAVRVLAPDGRRVDFTAIEWAELTVAWERVSVCDDEHLAWAE